MNKIKLSLNIINNFNNKINKENLVKSAQNLLTGKKFMGNFIIDLLVTDDKDIQKLNNTYMNKNTPTDVLSFPIYNKNAIKTFNRRNIANPILLGQIIISYPATERQAMKKKIKQEDEFNFLFLHGLKHLLGYHHK